MARHGVRCCDVVMVHACACVVVVDMAVVVSMVVVHTT